MTITNNSLRNQFIAEAYERANLTPQDARDMAEFFENIGSIMLTQITPVMVAYRSKIEERIRNEVIDKLIDTLNGDIPVLTRGSIVARLKRMKEKQ